MAPPENVGAETFNQVVVGSIPTGLTIGFCEVVVGRSEFVREIVPREREAFPDLNLSKRVRHPAGFAVLDAPIGTFLPTGLLAKGTQHHARGR
jgi:hypothetical protein